MLDTSRRSRVLHRALQRIYEKGTFAKSEEAAQTKILKKREGNSSFNINKRENALVFTAAIHLFVCFLLLKQHLQSKDDECWTKTFVNTGGIRMLERSIKRLAGEEEEEEGGGRKSTSNQKFNLVSILMSTELKCQQKCSHTWKTFNAFWTPALSPPALVSQIHLLQMGEVRRRPCIGTGPSPWKPKFPRLNFSIDPSSLILITKKNPKNPPKKRHVFQRRATKSRDQMNSGASPWSFVTRQ